MEETGFSSMFGEALLFEVSVAEKLTSGQRQVRMEHSEKAQASVIRPRSWEGPDQCCLPSPYWVQVRNTGVLSFKSLDANSCLGVKMIHQGREGALAALGQSQGLCLKKCGQRVNAERRKQTWVLPAHLPILEESGLLLEKGVKLTEYSQSSQSWTQRAFTPEFIISTQDFLNFSC